MYKKTILNAIIFFVSISTFSCGVLQKKQKDENSAENEVLNTAMKKKIPPDQAKEMLGEMGNNFLYGPGLGRTAINIGAIYLFPPYAIYVLGNAALDMSGYEPITPTMALPEKEKKQVDTFYDNVTSIPGRMTAAAAGKEFRSKENAKERIEKIIEDINTKQVKK